MMVKLGRPRLKTGTKTQKKERASGRKRQAEFYARHSDRVLAKAKSTRRKNK